MYEVNQLKVFFTALQSNFGEWVNIVFKICTTNVSLSFSTIGGIDMFLDCTSVLLCYTVHYLQTNTDLMFHFEIPFYTTLYPTCLFHHISFLSFIMRLPPPSSSFEFRVHVEVIFEISLNRFYNKVV